jgi:Leucine-rich repeat (LRR) protein
MEESKYSFSSSLPVVLYLYQPGQHPAEWREFDRGPGIFHIPAGSQVVVNIRTIGDKDLETLSREIVTCPAVTFLNLSENRNISDKGMEVFTSLDQLTGLNLSSCGITDAGMAFLGSLSHLQHLNLAFCNRISDVGLRYLHKLSKLTYLDLQGCVKTSQGGVSKLERKTLTIHR